ncbi:MAG: flagellar export chaperone FliS [Gammaproteobacteria bacterium]|nr:flagellar export chaperone FliS [Gammaproteobacteria bacterium]|tara:strand:+ start:342 stop:752 length:411 start_codon:yes stop_codon:yes gene_type:complete
MERALSKKDQNMYRRSALSAYADIDVQTKTSTEKPQELITLLFEKACVLMRQSQEQLKREDTEGFNNSTSHAMQIVLGLRGVLDMENGGELAAQLYETYTAISAALFKARAESDAVSIEKLYVALSELKEGWDMVK